jgi:dihydroflavonol-4-reductase
VRVSPPGGLNLVSIDDVARAHALALEKAKRGSIYLLGGENLSHTALLELVQSISGRARALVRVPRGGFRALGGLVDALAFVRRQDGEDETRLTGRRALEATLYWFVDSSKAERELGWRAGPVRPALEAQLADRA